jgi:type VI protein secretion system component Hcp
MMSFERAVLQGVSPDRWSLAGWVRTSAPIMPSGGSLKLIRRNDFFSPRIRAAMVTKTTLPLLEITTPDASVTLSDVTITNIEASGDPEKARHGTNQPGNEYVKISLTFRKIAVTGKIGGKGFKDDWSAGG